MKNVILFLLFLSIAFPRSLKVKTGADILFESKMELIDGKKIGLVTNHSAILSNGMHLADALFNHKKTKLVALFGPEHGIRGNAPDGRTVKNSVDKKTGAPIYSLYGAVNKPTPDMLKDVDVLVFDIQDVGARFYTFISTMFLCMESAAENNIPFIVLDRPNPINGIHVEGPVRLDSLKTFVGWVPIPIMHGMTVGELAVMANQQGWLKNGAKANLTVVKMENWVRSQWFDETQLQWINPSPNMQSLQTAIVYPGLCLIEGLNVSEGRGSDKPFEYIGAPWINGGNLAKLLNDQHLPGVLFKPITFTPKEIKNVASNPKYKNQQCQGVYVSVDDRNVFQSVKTGISVVWGIHSLYSDSLSFRTRGFDRLAGTPTVRENILAGKSFNEIISNWESELSAFEVERKKSLLY